MAQGFGVGGEWGGAVLMAVEHAPKGKRGFYGSWPQIGVPAGLLLSTIIYFPFSRMPEAAFLSWGWRVPFLLSIVLVAVGLFIRVRILETPAFERLKETRQQARLPIFDVVRKYPKEVLLAMGARFAAMALFTVPYSSHLCRAARAYGSQHRALGADRRRDNRTGCDPAVRGAVRSDRPPSRVHVRCGVHRVDRLSDFLDARHGHALARACRAVHGAAPRSRCDLRASGRVLQVLVQELLDHFPWTLGQTVPYLRLNGVTPPEYSPF
jgi:hypothetical protein